MNKKPIVLIVDDDAANIEIMDAALNDEYEICFALSGEDAMNVARQVLPDLILLDVLMPGMDGYEVCRLLKQESLLADVPVIFITGLEDQEAETRGLSEGAIDYVTKPIRVSVLRARVANHVELKRMRDKLAEMAVTDALTGLSNRRKLEQTLSTEAGRLARSGDWMSVIMLDIDYFKLFNDTYGHPAGDRCLVMVASALGRALRRSADLPARYGGEEFACILPHTDPAAALKVAQEIRNQVRQLGIVHERSPLGPYLTVSQGIASARCQPGIQVADWISLADGQLYESKRLGRDRVQGAVFDRDWRMGAAGTGLRTQGPSA